MTKESSQENNKPTRKITHITIFTPSRRGKRRITQPQTTIIMLLSPTLCFVYNLSPHQHNVPTQIKVPQRERNPSWLTPSPLSHSVVALHKHFPCAAIQKPTNIHIGEITTVKTRPSHTPRKVKMLIIEKSKHRQNQRNGKRSKKRDTHLRLNPSGPSKPTFQTKSCSLYIYISLSAKTDSLEQNKEKNI